QRRDGGADPVAQPRGVRRMDRHPRPGPPDGLRRSPGRQLPADHPLRGDRRLPQPPGAGRRASPGRPAGDIMKWVTRARPKTDRIACPWLITKFIDPDAEILYVPADTVLDVAATRDALSFDAPGARYD